MVQYIAIEEREPTERLVLGGSGHLLLHGQAGGAGFDLGVTYVASMALVVKQDEAGGLPDVDLLGTDGMALEADGAANLIQKFFGVLFRHRPFPPPI